MFGAFLLTVTRTVPTLASTNPATLAAYSVLAIGVSIAHRIITSGDVSNVEVGSGGFKATFYRKE